MNRDYSTALEKSLLAVDTGALVTRWPLEHISDTLTLAEHLTIHTEGKGKVDIYHVFPGIDVCFNQFLADKVLSAQRHKNNAGDQSLSFRQNWLEYERRDVHLS